MPLEKKEEKCD